MRRLYFALLSLIIVSSVLKAQTKVSIPSADSIKKIGKTGETCLPCAAAAKAAQKPKPVAAKPVVKKKPAPKAPEKKSVSDSSVQVVPQAVYKAILDSLRDCQANAKALSYSLDMANKTIAQLRDSLSKPAAPVEPPKAVVQTVYVNRTSKKAILAASIVSGGLGFVGGYFSHSKNVVTSTIIRNDMFLRPEELQLRQSQMFQLRFALPVGSR